MKHPIVHEPDPKLDLVLERVVDVPKELVWRAWTNPELLKKWFTPVPWQTVDCEIDLRPGGIFRTVMKGPEGQEFSNAGCYLEIVENQKLVWTGALGPGYRPRRSAENSADSFLMTAVISLESVGERTKYTALVIHGDEEARKKHEQMGFSQGWGKALDQLVAVAKKL
ncbi:MAG TPA: SRPBCC family protein [Steroidobacteraceae bacterium]|nr:SRPBCC family protein [Steroidobacteraceae bacterium]